MITWHRVGGMGRRLTRGQCLTIHWANARFSDAGFAGQGDGRYARRATNSISICVPAPNFQDDLTSIDDQGQDT